MKIKFDPLNVSLLLAIIAILIYAGIPLGETIFFSLQVKQENEQIRDEFALDDTGEHHIDFEALQEINPDICGWVYIKGTSIDYPIVQGFDNMEYLNKNAYGDSAIYGSIYLDSRNVNDFTNRYSLLYGHHMNDGNMFGDIDLFEDSTFYYQNRSGTLYTPQVNYALSAIAYMVTDCSDAHIFTPEQWDENKISQLYSYIGKHALNRSGKSTCADLYADFTVEAMEDDQLLALSTCSTHGETQRSILIMSIETDK